MEELDTPALLDTAVFRMCRSASVLQHELDDAESQSLVASRQEGRRSSLNSMLMVGLLDGSRLLRRELERVHASAHRTDVYEGAMLATGDSQSRGLGSDRENRACFCSGEQTARLAAVELSAAAGVGPQRRRVVWSTSSRCDRNALAWVAFACRVR